MLTDQKFKVIYEDFLESGLSIRSYCMNQGIGEAKFYYWQRRMKDLLPPRRGFVPLVFNTAGGASHPAVPFTGQPRSCPQPEDSSFCEITYPNGVRLRLHAGVDMQMLRGLLMLER
jgi:hypothetical protein